MNEHELRGGARYVGGKVEKAVGDVVESRDWQVGGVLNQVKGGAENLYGRAQSIVEDAVDAAPGVIDDAREKLAEAKDETVAAARRGSSAVAAQVRNGDERLIWVVAAAVGGYLAGWLIHRRGA